MTYAPGDGGRQGSNGPGAPPPRQPPRAPKWLVSSPHGIRVSIGGRTLWRPYPTFHARQAGSCHTACGATALDWPIFWELPFSSRPPSHARTASPASAEWEIRDPAEAEEVRMNLRLEATDTT